MNDRKHHVWWLLLGAAAVGLIAAIAQMTWKAREARLEAEREAAQKAEEAAKAERFAREQASRTFGAPLAPTPDDNAQFGPFFASLAMALEIGNASAVAGHFDRERMATELEHRGFFARFGPDDAAVARETFVNGFARVGLLVAEDTLYRWNLTRIRRVQWNVDRSAALVVATHWLAGRPEPLRMRWWLVSTDAGWKAYEVENFVGGVSLLALLEAASDVRELNKFEEQAIQVRSAVHAAVAGYPDIADQLLAPARNPKWPEVLAGPRALAEAFIRIHRGDPAAAVAFLDEAAKRERDMPLLSLGRTIVAARTGRYPEAVASASLFAAFHGDDFGIRCWQGFALEEQGQELEAAAAYQAALDEDPNSLVALNGLRRTTGQPQDLVKRIGEHRNPAAACAFLRRAARMDAVGFIDARWSDPEAPIGFDFLRDCARQLRVEELYASKQPSLAVETIGPVEKTFDQLAGLFVRDQDAAGLNKLLTTHERKFPNDPWLDFRHGDLHTLQGEHLQAGDRYLIFSHNPAASPADRYTASVLFVRSRIRSGDAAKAKTALNEIGPEWLPVGVRAAVLALVGDEAGIDRLLDVHAKSPLGLSPIYADEDFSRLIAGERFAELRKRYPDPRKK